jgi:hypothetical protein
VSADATAPSRRPLQRRSSFRSCSWPWLWSSQPCGWVALQTPAACGRSRERVLTACYGPPALCSLPLLEGACHESLDAHDGKRVAQRKLLGQVVVQRPKGARGGQKECAVVSETGPATPPLSTTPMSTGRSLRTTPASRLGGATVRCSQSPLAAPRYSSPASSMGSNGAEQELGDGGPITRRAQPAPRPSRAPRTGSRKGRSSTVTRAHRRE